MGSSSLLQPKSGRHIFDHDNLQLLQPAANFDFVCIMNVFCILHGHFAAVAG